MMVGLGNGASGSYGQAGPMYVCPTGESVFASSECPDVTLPSSACTCVGGTCVENGNSCSTVVPAGPVGSPAYIAQQAALQEAALRAMKPSWFPGVSNSTVLIAGGIVAGFIFLGRGKR